jgi:hypothetical protein
MLRAGLDHDKRSDHNASGFSIGAFVQVSCDIAAGSSPTIPDFSLSNFTTVDLSGLPLTGITPKISVAMQEIPLTLTLNVVSDPKTPGKINEKVFSFFS